MIDGLCFVSILFLSPSFISRTLSSVHLLYVVCSVLLFVIRIERDPGRLCQRLAAAVHILFQRMRAFFYLFSPFCCRLASRLFGDDAPKD